jgi:hypothetical protein
MIVNTNVKTFVRGNSHHFGAGNYYELFHALNGLISANIQIFLEIR